MYNTMRMNYEICEMKHQLIIINDRNNKRIKNNSSHSRFQVKWRRRREGKTNYYKRKNLLIQDKQKYNASKYRMVVRLSKKNLLCQLIYSRLEGDFILSSCYSKKLNLIGISLISNNFPTAYITGLHLSSNFLKEKFSFIHKKDSLENKLKVPKIILKMNENIEEIGFLLKKTLEIINNESIGLRNNLSPQGPKKSYWT